MPGVFDLQQPALEGPSHSLQNGEAALCWVFSKAWPFRVLQSDPPLSCSYAKFPPLREKTVMIGGGSALG